MQRNRPKVRLKYALHYTILFNMLAIDVVSNLYIPNHLQKPTPLVKMLEGPHHVKSLLDFKANAALVSPRLYMTS